MSQEQYELCWKDYYQVLGVNPQSEQEVIAAAYRAMAKKYHTDVAGGNSDRMREINEAFEYLSDPSKRQRYDVALRVRTEEQRRRQEEQMRAQYARAQQGSSSTNPGSQSQASSNQAQSRQQAQANSQPQGSGQPTGQSQNSRQSGPTSGQSSQSGQNSQAGNNQQEQAQSAQRDQPRGQTNNHSQNEQRGGQAGGQSNSGAQPPPSGQSYDQYRWEQAWQSFESSQPGESPRNDYSRPNRSPDPGYRRSQQPSYQKRTRYSRSGPDDMILPWPSTGWQRAGLILGILIGIAALLYAPTVMYKVIGGALALCSIYAAIYTKFITDAGDANLVAKVVGGTSIVVSLLSTGAVVLAAALGVAAILLVIVIVVLILTGGITLLLRFIL